jgi:hypothetical protein
VETTQRYTYTGEQLHRLGFSRLCSIIPPNAELSHNSHIDPSQCGKIPGRRKPSGVWAGYDWINTIPELNNVLAWDRAGAGIGIVCGVGDVPVIGLDIDVTDQALADLIVDIADRTLGFAPTRIGRSPKAMLVYQLDLLSAPVTWRKVKFNFDGAEHLVEVRGKGQQFVAAGVHPATGEPYYWDTDLTGKGGADKLPAISVEDIDKFFDTLVTEIENRGGSVASLSAGAGGQDRSGVDQKQLATTDLDWADKIVKALPNGEDDYPTRDDYIRVGCAIKAMYAEDEKRGLAAFDGWCKRWAGGQNDDDVILADWSRMKPPFEVGARWLAEQARMRGGFNDAEQLFEPSPHSQAKPREVETPEDNEAEFWSRYVYVENIKRFADMTTGALLDKEQFNDRWLGRVGSAASGMNSAAGIYMQFASRRVVAGVTYRPMSGQFIDEPGGKMLNIWKPGLAHGLNGENWYKYKASDADVKPWLDLVARLVPDPVERGHLLNWMAWQIQKPGQKCNWHPLMWGMPGIGKDTLFVPIVRGLGDNAAIIKADALSSNWTDWYEGKSLIVVEEINSFERRSVADKIKPMLTDPPAKLPLAKRFTNAYSVPNIANFVAFSNHADAQAIETGDRRWIVLHAAVKKTSFAADYFEQFYGWLDLGGDMMVCGWLGARDLSEFKAKGDAPQTEAKHAMRKASLGVVESVLVSAVEDQDGIFERDLLTMREIEEYVRQRSGGGLKIGPHKLGQIMKEVVGGERIGRVRVDGKLERIWSVRRADMYAGLAKEPKKLGSLYEKQRRDIAQARAEGIFEVQTAVD